MYMNMCGYVVVYFNYLLPFLYNNCVKGNFLWTDQLLFGKYTKKLYICSYLVCMHIHNHITLKHHVGQVLHSLLASTCLV